MEEKAPKKKQEKKGKQRIPVYFIVVVIVLVIVAALVLNKAFLSPPKQPIKPFNGDLNVFDTDLEKVKLILVFSSECTFCDKDNSILASLKSKNVPLEIEYFDVVNDSNKEFQEKYGITMVPTGLVEINGIKRHPELFAIFEKYFKQREGFFVIPEIYLDSLPHKTMQLNRVESCWEEKGKVKLYQFCDYLAKPCSDSIPKIKELREKFGEEMEFEFRNLVEYVNSEKIAIAAECIKKQSIDSFEKYRETVFDWRFPKTGEGKDTTLKNVLYEAAFQSNIPDWDAFDKCFNEKETEVIAGVNGIDSKIARTYALGEYHFGILHVIDCKYVVTPFEELEETICSLHPELKACKTE